MKKIIKYLKDKFNIHKTIVKCEKCGWKGTKYELLISMNTKHIYRCPDCLSFKIRIENK